MAFASVYESDDLLKRDFTADAPLQKCVTDITEIPAKDGKLYVSAIFDCYDLLPVGLAMADHMRAELCCEQKDRTLQNGRTEIHGLAVFHELLEQPQDLLVHWRAFSCCKVAKILRSGCHCTFRFIILVGNVSSVIDNFRDSSITAVRDTRTPCRDAGCFSLFSYFVNIAPGRL